MLRVIMIYVHTTIPLLRKTIRSLRFLKTQEEICLNPDIRLITAPEYKS